MSKVIPVNCCCHCCCYRYMLFYHIPLIIIDHPRFSRWWLPFTTIFTTIYCHSLPFIAIACSLSELFPCTRRFIRGHERPWRGERRQELMIWRSEEPAERTDLRSIQTRNHICMSCTVFFLLSLSLWHAWADYWLADHHERWTKERPAAASARQWCT